MHRNPTGQADEPDTERVAAGPVMGSGSRLGIVRDHAGAVAAAVSHGVYPGLLCGALIGGVGGRLAMYLLRLTTGATVHGVTTDDDFTIGAFTGATFFLIAAMTLAGAVLGLGYVLIRDWLPVRRRPVWVGAGLAVIGGALVIQPGGVDFTVLSPLWLAVLLFVLLPGCFGFALSALAEALVRSGRAARGWWRWPALLALGLFGLAFGTPGLVGLGLFVLMIAAGQGERLAVLWRSRPVQWTGRALLGLFVVVAGVNLARDVVTIL